MQSSTNPSGYRWRPGAHCASSALRDLALHASGGRTDYPEWFILGAGSGADMIAAEFGDGRFFINGRSLNFVDDAAAALGWNVREGHAATEVDGCHGTVAVREITDFLSAHPDTPVLVFGDTYHLPHFPHRYLKSHFPGHAFVVTAVDRCADVAYVAERDSTDLAKVPISDLASAMDPPGSPFSTRGRWLWFEACEPLASEAVRHQMFAKALRTSSVRFFRTRADSGSFLACGKEGFEVLRTAVETWAVANTDRDVKRFVTLVAIFETKGTGGGNFRAMTARFLEEVEVAVAPNERRRWSALTWRAASAYKALVPIAQQLQQCDNAAGRPALWAQAIGEIVRAAAAEETVATQLRERFAAVSKL